MERLDEGLYKLREALNEASNQILLYGEASLPPPQYKAFRKLVLNAMGISGVEGKARKIFDTLKQKGQA